MTSVLIDPWRKKSKSAADHFGTCAPSMPASLAVAPRNVNVAATLTTKRRRAMFIDSAILRHRSAPNQLIVLTAGGCRRYKERGRYSSRRPTLPRFLFWMVRRVAVQKKEAE